MISNRLDRTFGPFGSSTGFFLIFGGIATTFFSLFGIILILIGAFAAFTTTSTFIDPEKRKIKFSNNLFGIIRVGKWIDIKDDMKLGLKKSHKGYVGYIRGTQPMDIHLNDIRIVLFDSGNTQVMQVKKCSSREAAESEMKKLQAVLGLAQN